MLIGAALLATPALAEDRAALIARSPALALDGPVAPLAAALQVGGTGWGPFRRLCVAKTMLRPDDGQEVATSPPSCFNVEEARDDGGTWRLALRTDPLPGGMRVAFTTTRDAAGMVGEADIAVPEGVAAPPPPVMARLRGIFRAAIEANGMPRATIAPGVDFVMPLPIGAVDPDLRVERDGLVCSADGEAMADGRRVLVATCGASGGGEISPGRAMRVLIAGRFAIDVATGMVLRHGYGSWLEMEADPRGSMGRMEMRGVSRQTLE
ncbi:hypothetical protein J5Y09_17620 [Roseomonas sp. PWR1]|uniref:Protease inhibitor Inh n=1 Tax=Roseomonas nitratireducens TaxID=2820810 RepID=A0ABS4AWJ6_9PROT|nr:hypothetical protein [Neoroseomonas nitratireducens]MBP0465751.1 hypothetical protein [Neoroseomonas nitratireducens]